VSEAAEILVEAADLHRVDIEVSVPESGITWASAGLPSLVADLQDYWPDCEQDLTFEIAFAMRAAPTYRAKHGARLEKFRVEMNEAMADLFEKTDIVLCATSPMEPFKAEGPMPNMVGEVSVSPYNAGALTIPANLSGYPAISIPAGLSENGLPIGLQAYARRHEDALLLDLAQIMEQVRPWPKTAPPPLRPSTPPSASSTHSRWPSTRTCPSPASACTAIWATKAVSRAAAGAS